MAAKEEIRVRGLAEPVSHYTDVVKIGNLIFISGMAAVDQAGNVLGGADPTEQARYALANLKRCLDAAGATPADVCKVTVYLRDIRDRARVNVARREFFGESHPASTLVQVSNLFIEGLLLEIEAIAVLPD